MSAAARVLRPAEEIAETSVADLGLEPMTEDRVRIAMTSLIERRDAEHAASRRAAKLRDLAGRIRALMQRKAGEWADTTDMAHANALLATMQRLREVLMFQRVGWTWTAAQMFDHPLDNPSHRDVFLQTADELEAIIRDCEAQQ